MTKTNSTTYDPGTATTPRQTSPNTWEIDSFRGESAYRLTVTAERTTCSCPHYVERLSKLEGAPFCKHGKAVHAAIEAEKPTALEAAAAKVKTLTEEELLRLARYYQGQVPGAACWLELARRQAAADLDAQYRAIFS